MTLRLYNSMRKQKEVFVPRNPGVVHIYVCGMTVYDFCHIGHARVLIVFDLLVRWLRQLGYRVIYVRNITDIDDKIIRKAQGNGESTEALAGRFITAMHEDCAALGLLPPDHEPQATDYVGEMVSMIRALEEKGMAYQGSEGDVYFSVRRFPSYGQLSGKSLDQLRAGERIDVASDKQDPLDFVLWKKAKAGEPTWPSPWGDGRPGWHIECSAMSAALLGEAFDIHGGGQDLQFPHHENEIAQSDGTYGHSCVKYWMHNGFVRVDDTKMSKSLGNFFTIRQVLEHHPAEVLRYLMLRTHYRSPLNYSEEQLNEARHSLARLYTALIPYSASTELELKKTLAVEKFHQVMNDDFNTPEAIAVLHDLASEANRGDEHAAVQLRHLGQMLGLLQSAPETYLQSGVELSPQKIEEKIAARLAARQAKDFAKADLIRNDLLAQNIVLEDNAKGTQWRRL